MKLSYNLNIMTTLSIPINGELERFIEEQISSGKAANKADVVRKALRFYREEQAFMDLLEAEADVKAGRVYKGDLDKIVKKLKI